VFVSLVFGVASTNLTASHLLLYLSLPLKSSA